jgi:hypothetical protein
MKKLMMVAVLLMVTSPAFALKDCGELMSEIDAKIQANGAKNYNLEIISKADVKNGQVVGSCDGGTKKIIYQRGK